MLVPYFLIYENHAASESGEDHAAPCGAARMLVLSWSSSVSFIVTIQ